MSGAATGGVGHSKSVWLGTVAFGAWGNPDHRECVEVLRTALDRGVTAIDTAELYSDGESEQIVGEALVGRRDEVFVATKGGHTHGGGRLTADKLVRSLEASLTRLKTDHVDLYQLHRLDPRNDVDEILQAMSDMVESGKALAIGGSGLRPEWIVDLQRRAAEDDRAAFTYEQAPYSIFVREIETEVIPACRRLGVSVVAFAPLNGSFLTGKYRPDVVAPPGSRASAWPMKADRFSFDRPEVEEKLRISLALQEVADEAGMSLIEMALRFSLSHPDIDAAVVGVRNLEQLASTLPTTVSPLEPAILSAIDRLVLPGSTVDPRDIDLYTT